MVKYRCCHCSEVFEGREAVDGYNDGFTVGFLCPKCGANIISDRKAEILASEKLRGRKLLTVAILIFVLGKMFWGEQFEEATGIDWYGASLPIILMAAGAIYYLNRENKEMHITPTKYVDSP